MMFVYELREKPKKYHDILSEDPLIMIRVAWHRFSLKWLEIAFESMPPPSPHPQYCIHFTYHENRMSSVMSATVSTSLDTFSNFIPRLKCNIIFTFVILHAV
jgi:hypothetical protein